MRLTLDARTAAFAGLIDDAALFPPASLSMDAAVAGHRSHRASASGWVVGRFLCRASRLQELAAVAMPGHRRDEPAWRIGVIADMSPGATASVAREFHQDLAPALAIDGVEVKLTDDRAEHIGEILDAVATIDRDVATWLEVDLGGDVATQVHAIGEARRERGSRGGAKIRCGGETAAEIPSTEDVAGFIWETSLSSVPFKATAGLHQPVRHADAGLGAFRHGFVNLLVAAAAAEAGEPYATVEAIVGEADPDAFAFSAMAATWRELAIPGSAIRRVRRDAFTALGSCDFDEPVTALVELGFLGVGA